MFKVCGRVANTFMELYTSDLLHKKTKYYKLNTNIWISNLDDLLNSIFVMVDDG